MPALHGAQSNKVLLLSAMHNNARRENVDVPRVPRRQRCGEDCMQSLLRGANGVCQSGSTSPSSQNMVVSVWERKRGIK